MDGQIKLRHEDTDQECTFADRAAAEDFTHNIADPGAWKLVHDAEPAATSAAPAEVSPDATGAATAGSITATAE